MLQYVLFIFFIFPLWDGTGMGWWTHGSACRVSLYCADLFLKQTRTMCSIVFRRSVFNKVDDKQSLWHVLPAVRSTFPLSS